MTGFDFWWAKDLMAQAARHGMTIETPCLMSSGEYVFKLINKFGENVYTFSVDSDVRKFLIGYSTAMDEVRRAGLYDEMMAALDKLNVKLKANEPGGGE